jgi:hypothetical protein
MRCGFTTAKPATANSFGIWLLIAALLALPRAWAKTPYCDRLSPFRPISSIPLFSASTDLLCLLPSPPASHLPPTLVPRSTQARRPASSPWFHARRRLISSLTPISAIYDYLSGFRRVAILTTTLHPLGVHHVFLRRRYAAGAPQYGQR